MRPPSLSRCRALAAAGVGGGAAAAIAVIDQQENDDDEQDPGAVIAAEEIPQTHIFTPPYNPIVCGGAERGVVFLLCCGQ